MLLWWGHGVLVCQGHGGTAELGSPRALRWHRGDGEPWSRWASILHPDALGDAVPGWHGEGDPNWGTGSLWGPGAAESGWGGEAAGPGEGNQSPPHLFL